MEQSIFYLRKHHLLHTSLHFEFCGFSRTLPFHSFGPAIRDYYILHIVLEGRGVYSVKDQQYSLKKGDFFLIRPGESTFYSSDSQKPWMYAWLAFSGTTADEIIEHSPFGTAHYTASTQKIDPYVKTILNCLLHQTETLNDELKLAENTYHFLRTFLLDAQPVVRDAPKKLSPLTLQVMEQVRNHYAENKSIQQIASDLAVNRSHLSRQFKQDIGISIQQWQIGIRVNQAAFLLNHTQLSIEAIAEQVGFGSLITLSRTFHQQTGETPSQYRKRSQTESIAYEEDSELWQSIRAQAYTSRST